MTLGDILNSSNRIPRSVFWACVAGVFIVEIILGALVHLVGQSPIVNILAGIIALVLLCFSIIVQVQRWHDLNKSGWFVLLNLIPLIGGLISLIFLGFIKGTEGMNRFGPDPLEKR